MTDRRLRGASCALLTICLAACPATPDPQTPHESEGAQDMHPDSGPIHLAPEMDMTPQDQEDARPSPVDMSAQVDAASARDQGPEPKDLPDARDDLSDLGAADQGRRPDIEPGGPPVGDPELTAGTGRQSFRALSQGDPIRWEAGPQGGHHIWVSARLDPAWIEGLDEDARRGLRTSYTLTHVDGTVLARTMRLGAWRSRDAGWTHVGQYAVLEVRRRPSLMDGDWLELFVELEHEEDRLESRVWLQSACCD